MNLDDAPVLQQTPPGLGAAGRFRVRRRLGQGGYGDVFEAWDSELQRLVAVKRLFFPLDDGDWISEARLASRVSHPAFVIVYDVFEHEGLGHIVMEFVQGHDLAQRLRDGPPVTPREAAQWMLEASAVLAQAHREQVVHGDIKPGNLMLDQGGRLRLLDFGIARTLERTQTASHSAKPDAAGTLAYMAPEQLLGAPASEVSDIHALGLVLLTLLLGHGGAATTNKLAFAYQRLHADEQVPALPGVPPALRDLLQRMLRRDPTQRPGSMGAVQAELQVILADWSLDDGPIEHSAPTLNLVERPP